MVTSTAIARRIELWPLDRLVPYSKNARTHSDEQVMQIAASIAQFGFTNPLLVDSKAGILAGHGRLLAAQKLGLTEVPRTTRASDVTVSGRRCAHSGVGKPLATTDYWKICGTW